MGCNGERGLALVRGNKHPMLLGNCFNCMRVVNRFRAGLRDDRFGIAQRGACNLNGRTTDPTSGYIVFYSAVRETVRKKPERSAAWGNRQGALQSPAGK